MPRIKTPRKLSGLPAIKGFRPYGPDINKQAVAIILHFEEYEAVKLCDYEGLNHNMAARLMQVSRPTFTRIYASARNKIAQAFVEGRPIEVEGGSAYFDSNWFKCTICGCFFNQVDPSQQLEACPLCGKKHFQQMETQEFTNLQAQKS